MLKREVREKMLEQNILLTTRILQALFRIREGEAEAVVLRDLKLPPKAFRALFHSKHFCNCIEEITEEPYETESFNGVSYLPTLNPYEDLFLDVAGVRELQDIPSDVEKTMKNALKNLTDRERKIIRMRYWNYMTLDECAKVLHLSRDRVRQIQACAMSKLRRPHSFQYMHYGDSYFRKHKQIRLDAELEFERNRVAELRRAENELAELRIEEADLEDSILRIIRDKLSDRKAVKLKCDSTTIEEMELSVRSYNCLKRAGIDTIKDLKTMNLYDLKQVRNLGNKSIIEIIEKYEAITGDLFDTSTGGPKQEDEEDLR